VSYPRFKLKYVRFYFRRSNDAENDENLTKKVKDTLLKLYEYYIKVEDVEVMNDVETNIND
jgi:hypothetical protein